MFCAQILCDSLKFIDTSYLQIVEIIIQSNVLVPITGINIVEFTIHIRVESQAESINMILVNIDDREVLLSGNETNRIHAHLTIRMPLIHIRNADQLRKCKFCIIQILHKYGSETTKLHFPTALFCAAANSTCGLSRSISNRFSNNRNIHQVQCAIVILVSNTYNRILCFA